MTENPSPPPSHDAAPRRDPDPAAQPAPRLILPAGGGRIVVGVLALALLLWGAFAVSRPGSTGEGVRATLSAASALAGVGEDLEGFARAEGPRPFVFPDDHGAHPDFRTEWWYLTGHLDEEGGDGSWGFQLTFFRNALTPEPPSGASAWRTNQLWMAHFALTDVRRDQHVYGERFARGAAGLAGAEVAPFRVWLEDWVLESVLPATLGAEQGSPQAIFPLRLYAAQDNVRLELMLDGGKPPVLQGIDGWSRKGSEPGNASYYLSWTRMPLQGTVEVDGRRVSVRGQGWMDREWSTSALEEVHVGWDWFSLQLDDGRELMFFELRREDGGRDPWNHGTLVGVGGETRALGVDDVDVEVLGHWVSPLDGARYPSGWRLRVPSEGLDLTLTPRVRNQEMNVTVRYWEGALTVEGTDGGRPITGRGYAELTGYAEAGLRGQAPL